MKLTKMINEETGQTADVHPDEVENYAKGGFRVDESAPKAQKPRGKKVADD